MEAWGQGLLQLVCLLLVVDHQGVEEPGAANLELDIVGVLLDLDAAGVLPARLKEKVLQTIRMHFHVNTGFLYSHKKLTHI